MSKYFELMNIYLVYNQKLNKLSGLVQYCVIIEQITRKPNKA